MSLHPTRNYLKEFKGNHNIFVETGSYKGDAIWLAMDAGFKYLHSMDIDPANVEHCRKRFDLENKNHNINIICADSAIALSKLLRFVTEPAMFWLDAHSQLFDDEQPTENPFPLLQELHQLAKHPIKNHTILIDDILMLTHPNVTGWNRDVIENSVLMINPAYKLTYLSNPVVNNVLLAHV
jgi:hypothetical protein